MTVGIIDYGSGNLRSVERAFARAGADASLVREAAALAQHSHIVLPGVGAFADCMAGLKSLPGMLEALEQEVRQKKKPFLGICVGMQMLFERGHEHGAHEGLGWLKGEVVKIDVPGLKIPHMGWNALEIAQPKHPLLSGVKEGSHAYFVHSYHAKGAFPDDILLFTDYGGPVVAAVGHENILGTQFHPEKSQETGLRIIDNFLTL